MADRFDKIASQVLLDITVSKTAFDARNELADALRRAYALGRSEGKAEPSDRRVRTALRRAQRRLADVVALEEIVHAMCDDRWKRRYAHREAALSWMRVLDLTMREHTEWRVRAEKAEAAWHAVADALGCEDLEPHTEKNVVGRALDLRGAEPNLKIANDIRAKSGMKKRNP